MMHDISTQALVQVLRLAQRPVAEVDTDTLSLQIKHELGNQAANNEPLVAAAPTQAAGPAPQLAGLPNSSPRQPGGPPGTSLQQLVQRLNQQHEEQRRQLQQQQEQLRMLNALATGGVPGLAGLQLGARGCWLWWIGALGCIAHRFCADFYTVSACVHAIVSASPCASPCAA